MKKLTRAAYVLAFSGLGGLAVVILSGAAYPDPLFQILTPLSLLMVFASLPLLALSWCGTIRREWQEKNYLSAALRTCGALLILLRALYQLLAG